jgi:hypothetical protein
MKRFLLPLTGLALALSLSACGGSSGESAASQATSEAISAPVVTETVPWSDYSPTLKNDLDALASAMNCQELQSQFDIADQNNQATMDRTGHNNADLMGYIDSLMQSAGCY